MHPVIAAYDGSPNAEDALAFAAYLAELHDAPLEIACVYPVDGRAARSYDEVMRVTAQDTLDRARTRAAVGTKAIYKPLPGTSVARALHERCVERQAAALVIGSSRHGAAHRAMAGTTAARLLHGSPCPVAVVPAGWAAEDGRRPERIVVAFDEGDEARHALAAAEDLARRAHLPMELVEVVPSGMEVALEWPMYPVPTHRGPSAVEAARTRLESCAESIDAVVHVHTTALSGEPPRALREHVAPSDLLVLGSRAYGPLQSVLLGSVAKSVVASSACPVMVVPRGARPTPAEGPVPASSAAAEG